MKKRLLCNCDVAEKIGDGRKDKDRERARFRSRKVSKFASAQGRQCLSYRHLPLLARLVPRAAIRRYASVVGGRARRSVCPHCFLLRAPPAHCRGHDVTSGGDAASGSALSSGTPVPLPAEKQDVSRRAAFWDTALSLEEHRRTRNTVYGNVACFFCLCRAPSLLLCARFGFQSNVYETNSETNETNMVVNTSSWPVAYQGHALVVDESRSFVYWATNQAIYRADAKTGEARPAPGREGFFFAQVGTGQFRGLAINVTTNNIFFFWTESSKHRPLAIQFDGLTGKNVTVVQDQTAGEPADNLAALNGLLYWGQLIYKPGVFVAFQDRRASAQQPVRLQYSDGTSFVSPFPNGYWSYRGYPSQSISRCRPTPHSGECESWPFVIANWTGILSAVAADPSEPDRVFCGF